MPLSTRTTTLPAPLLASTVLLPVVPLPISMVTLPPPVLAVALRLAALSGSTTSRLPPPVSAATCVAAISARSSLTLPPSLWATMSDATVGLRWICHSSPPTQASHGRRNQDRPVSLPVSVRVVWPLLVSRVLVGKP